MPSESPIGISGNILFADRSSDVVQAVILTISKVRERIYARGSFTSLYFEVRPLELTVPHSENPLFLVSIIDGRWTQTAELQR